jgi:hypothetical protein
VEYEMPDPREILMSTYRAGKMKKVRLFAYASQAILVIIVLIAITILTPDTSFNPLYLPFKLYILVIGLVLLIVNAESFFFKSFGIRIAKSDSEKYLSAKDYTRWALVIVILAIAILVMVIFLAPIMDESIDEKRTDVVYGVNNYEFTSQDSLGITGVEAITLTQEDEYNQTLNVYILHKDDFENEYYDKRLNIDENESIGIWELDYKRNGFLPYDDYVLYIDAGNQRPTVTFTLERGISQSFLFYLTIFPIIFIAMNAAWIIFLWPLRKRYEETSIYK